MLIVAHRGSSAVAPENTLISFSRAWAEFADAIEFDVLLTRDRYVVVHHDENAMRTTGVDALIADSDYETLRKLDAGSWKGAQWTGEKIPTLSEVLKTVPEGRKAFVEVKCGPEILPALCRDVEAAGMERDRILFVGFSPNTMHAVKKAFPKHRVLLNVECGTYGGEASAGVIALARGLGLDGIGPGIDKVIDAEAVRLMLAEGMDVFAWTVDDPAQARLLRDIGVQHLVTNKPGFMRKELSHE
jgi:glycerophosphoryl diester phosphodiesterase